MNSAVKRGLFTVLLVLAVWGGRVWAQGLPTALHDEQFFKGEALLLHATMDTGSIFNGGYPIDSSGYADLPIIGRVEVAGHGRDEVEAFISAKLANYLRDTHIKVTPAIRLTLLGHWMRPGQYYVSPHATLFEAVLPAGGIAGERTLDEILVQRGEINTGIRFLTLYSNLTTIAQSGIRSGDIVIVPVPRDNTGFWYWMNQSISLTAQIATIAGAVLTAYVTYMLIQERN